MLEFWIVVSFAISVACVFCRGSLRRQATEDIRALKQAEPVNYQEVYDEYVATFSGTFEPEELARNADHAASEAVSRHRSLQIRAYDARQIEDQEGMGVFWWVGCGAFLLFVVLLIVRILLPWMGG